MPSSILPLVLSVFSVAIIAQNHLANEYLRQCSAACTAKLGRTARLGDSLRARLNATRAATRRAEAAADRGRLRAAEERAERAGLLAGLRALQREEEELRMQTGEVQMALAKLRRIAKPRPEIKAYKVGLRKAKTKTLVKIAEVKSQLDALKQAYNKTQEVEEMKDSSNQNEGPVIVKLIDRK